MAWRMVKIENQRITRRSTRSLNPGHRHISSLACMGHSKPAEYHPLDRHLVAGVELQRPIRLLRHPHLAIVHGQPEQPSGQILGLRDFVVDAFGKLSADRHILW